MKFLTNDVVDTTLEGRLFASLPVLLHSLATHINAGSSGNFFIVTDDNASCRFVLRHGKITHCAFKRHKGHAALEAMITSEIRGMARFIASHSPLRQSKEVIDHDYVISVLDIKTLSPEDTENLSTEDKKYLIYRGQKTEVSANNSAAVVPTKKTSQRMYRGQPID